jgi:RNA polymerase-binding transcription factor DksA
VSRQAGDRLAIEQQRAAAAARLEALTAELDGIIEAAAADPPDDEHDVEGASVGFERARVAALADAERRRLSDLDDALARLDAGTYGVCQSCGMPIPPERLEALPAATRCVACATARSRAH